MPERNKRKARDYAGENCLDTCFENMNDSNAKRSSNTKDKKIKK